MLATDPSPPSDSASSASPWRRFGYPLSITLLLGVWLALAMTHLDFFAFEDDEGTFLLTAKSLWQNHELYQDVWLNYFSGLMTLLELVFRVGGPTVMLPRALMALLAAVTMLLSSSIARRLGGDLAGISTVALLILTPAMSRMGRSVMAEVPAAACGALAVWALQTHLRSRRLGWLALAGLAAGLGIWFKYPTAALLLTLLATLWIAAAREHLPRKAVAGQTALFLALALLPILVNVLWYDLAPQWDQIVGTYMRNLDLYDPNIPRNLDKFGEYFGDNNWGLAALAVPGVLILLRRQRTAAWLLGGWVLVYFVLMLLNRPLGSHHMYLLLAPLAILAAVAMARLPQLVRTSRQRSSVWLARIALAGVFMALAVFLLLGPESIETTIDRYRYDRKRNEALYEVTAVVAANTLPNDYVVSDLPMITFRAGRTAPPWLTNTSGMRFRTEGLSDKSMLAWNEAYRPVAVVFWEDKFVENAPDFVAEIQATYVEIYRDDVLQEDGDRRLRAVYLRPDRVK